jgi:hypothetical protein
VDLEAVEFTHSAQASWAGVCASVSGSGGNAALKTKGLVAVAGGLALGRLAVQYRRWHLRWGATDEELGDPLPGDEMCNRPNFAFTRAITIKARPEEIWEWLVQIGYGRAGWYSYDLLDNLGHHSSERIIPDLQHMEVGNWVPMSGKANEVTAMRVKAFETNEWLLWEHQGASWVWVLRPIEESTTRLITRGRQRYSWTSPMLPMQLILMEVGDFFMMRRLLLNVKRRVERLATERQPRLDSSPVHLEVDPV